LLNGLNELPEADEKLREQLRLEWEENPNRLVEELKQKDPGFASQADLNNPRRVMRALEVIRTTGKQYSELRTGEKPVLFFNYKCFALMPEREELYARINARTPVMIKQGWLNEVNKLMDFRQLNALQTVGYRELFEYLDGVYGMEETIERIRMNTRRYAKRQVTWIKNKLKCKWIKPENGFETILNETKDY
ncbi:MAG: tRNA (adenosine(37)-N6)-dimethylallyltransferase MiaA, partial [Bacteroidetes bacterium]|nr:tRNA (adenosine(37)-N6)-dimethylallyltransferase MiaA [Bacteroidota bacterium]